MREHLWSRCSRQSRFDVRQGDGARNLARWADRSGELISNDPTLVAILKIAASYCLHGRKASSSAHGVGGRGAAWSSDLGPAILKKNVSFVKDTYVFNLPGTPSELVGAFRNILWADHECIRSCRKNRSGRRSAEGAGRSVQQSKQKPQQGRHLHSCDLLTSSHCRAVITRLRLQGLDLTQSEMTLRLPKL